MTYRCIFVFQANCLKIAARISSNQTKRRQASQCSKTAESCKRILL
ncbi:unnamed protein product [Moneuplotes crassus]|uniref:Uncharacterized protein n=1 Tax=Euplotes crassus TaxID=5936 RepID=A0AAD1U7H9_EUPCR|nr:unnamed protein product [Moneuplotes crassus]